MARPPLAVSIREAARMMGLTEAALRAYLHRGIGPPVRKLSPRRAIILMSEFQAWLDSLDHVSRPRLLAEPEPELEIDLDDDPELHP